MLTGVEMSRPTGRAASAVTAVVFCLILPAYSQTIENRHVYSLANELADEIELIREVMGRPYDDSPRLPVSGVTLYELYYHAQTLVRQSNQLAQEVAGAAPVFASDQPNPGIVPADVYRLIELALADIRIVKSELEIAESVPQDVRAAPIAPTGIFSVVIDSNRQLNLLVRNPIRSADVYDELHSAITYAGGILASSGGMAAFPDAPFEGHKRPADVYARILECLDIVAEIASQTGVEIVDLSSRRNVPDDVEPGHVYDLAKMLLADLALIAATLGAEPIEPESIPRPKHVFPSHAFERAGILRTQLELLAQRL